MTLRTSLLRLAHYLTAYQLSDYTRDSSLSTPIHLFSYTSFFPAAIFDAVDRIGTLDTTCNSPFSIEFFYFSIDIILQSTSCEVLKFGGDIACRWSYYPSRVIMYQ